ncbi:dUTP diphosphatase [Tenuibacillus multivorans]|uniref:Dimeric dUTPase, all-alpha-NTP-PPase (MazG) superfamily n=1 Tax=Tenuibacillus multivorans TaxID=237069 RepID=A0A1G9ZT37_9BACI|nr:dUTP diphosphatase [Tenuibacillus multivorans]GEL76822.1 hypothetical protein TMU01_10570 [Tenuibacillus multivorans]SDN23833.1 Dimeric dUTPase, all-alpha-NTP-PPase (MazG) superfamily [Tenuibacillus multivorans]
MMDWDKLYALQRQLDDEIMDRIPKTRDEVLDDKILALIVEVSELANETRCFKYWSQKGPNNQSDILEEYVDGIHFLLSLGIDLGFKYHHRDHEVSAPSITAYFHKIYEGINSFKQNPSQEHYLQLWLTYLSLGMQLGFSEQDIYDAYLNKNKVNHERQQSGY